MLNDQTMKEVYAPFISIVSAPPSCVTPLGKTIFEADVDLTARLLFMQKMHKTHPGTGAVCTAAAIRIPGSIPHRLGHLGYHAGHDGPPADHSLQQGGQGGGVFRRAPFPVSGDLPGKFHHPGANAG